MRSMHWLTLLFIGFIAFAQMNTGELSGIVKDLTSVILPGATIIAEHVETGQTFAAVTNNSGEYLLPQLPVGTYSLTVILANFKQSTLPRLEVHASDRLRR